VHASLIDLVETAEMIRLPTPFASCNEFVRAVFRPRRI
jgi:hypothetical protein